MPLLDVILGYDCNLFCDYCTITLEMRRRALETGEVLRAMRAARTLGFDAISFTGGEPTIRPDLLGLVRAARALGYDDVKVQSNGLLYAEPANVDRMIEGGVTRFHVSIHTHDAARYERLVRREGTYAAMVAGLDALVARGVTLVADVIVKNDTCASVSDAIRWLHARGVREAHLWYVSLTDGNRDNLASLVPMTEAMPALREGFAFARASGMELRSLHVPRCLLGDDAPHALDPAADRVRVVTPDAIFDLAESALTPNVHVPACEGCEHRTVCRGVRRDYLERYGDAEIAAARGQAPAIAPSRRLPVSV